MFGWGIRKNILQVHPSQQTIATWKKTKTNDRYDLSTIWCTTSEQCCKKMFDIEGCRYVMPLHTQLWKRLSASEQSHHVINKGSCSFCNTSTVGKSKSNSLTVAVISNVPACNESCNGEPSSLLIKTFKTAFLPGSVLLQHHSFIQSHTHSTSIHTAPIAHWQSWQMHAWRVLRDQCDHLHRGSQLRRAPVKGPPL